MRERVNDCVGCEYCINCGRKDYYTVIYCDNCGEETSDSYYWKDGEYCLSCLAFLIARAHIDSNVTEKNYREKIEDYFCKHKASLEDKGLGKEIIELFTHFSEYSELEFEDIYFLCLYFNEEFPTSIEDPFI